MYFRFIVSFTILAIISLSNDVYSARILGVFPTPSISHQLVFRGLTLALNKRGHELVVVTPDPVNDINLINYKEIDVSFLYDDFDFGNHIDSREEFEWLDAISKYNGLINSHCEQILGDIEVKKLYAKNKVENFDLILIEMLFTPVFLAFGKLFDAPIIGITSLSLLVPVHYGIGNPIYPTHPSNWESRIELSESRTLWERLNTFVKTWRYIYFYRNVLMRQQEGMAKNYFGYDSPDIFQAERNVSLIFVNQQDPISFARPNVPKVIGIGGFHISKYIEPLPENLREILDQATQGFVYMSLGTNVKSNMISGEKLAEYINAFSRLPYKVIWKFENDIFPNKPDNVVIMKWTPQQAILAHPNIKVFIYQGGLQSTEEAVAQGVPLIGMPVVGDQDTQINKMVSLGVAKKLEITRINSDDILDAINTVVNDISYKRRMMNLRELIRDKPYDPLENAVWWTEHVIRNRGAPQLHSITADQLWYERQDFDIIFFISSGLTTALLSSLIIIYKFLTFIVKLFEHRSIGDNEKKEN